MAAAYVVTMSMNRWKVANPRFKAAVGVIGGGHPVRHVGDCGDNHEWILRGHGGASGDFNGACVRGRGRITTW